MIKTRKESSQEIILVLILFFVFTECLFSQEIKIPQEPRKNLVSVNLVPLAIKSYNLLYEYSITQHSSFGLDANYYIKDQLLIFQRIDSRWYGLTAGYNYYLDGTFRGFYAGTYIKYRLIRDFDVVNYLENDGGMLSIATPPQDETRHGLGFGAIGGYKYTNKWGLCFGAFLGTGYFPFTWVVAKKPNLAQRRASKVDARLGLTIGWAF